MAVAASQISDRKQPGAQSGLILPMSYGQAGLWYLDQLEPGNLAYNMSFAASLTGAVDEPALQWSLNQTVSRHEVLRTSFSASEGRHVQIIAPSLDLRIEHLDLGAVPESEREDRCRAAVSALVHSRFDLARAPLLRVMLLRLSAREHVLAIVIHHIICDGESLTLLCKELSVLYNARLANVSPDVPALPIQFADFALWQVEQAQGGHWNTQLDYWRECLRGGVTPVLLPTDRPRPAVRTFRGAVLEFDVDPTLCRALERSRLAAGSNYTVFLATFQALLARYTGQRDIILATPVSTRTSAETQNLIGLLVNTVVQRADCPGHLSFRELLRQVRKNALDALDHSAAPFELLCGALARDGKGQNMSCQIGFDFYRSLEPSLSLSGIQAVPFTIERRTAKLDVYLALSEKGGSVGGSLEYNCDIFDRATAAAMCSHLQVLLADAIERPDEPIRRLRVVTAPELREICEIWSRPATPCGETGLVQDLFDEQAIRTPDQTAIICGENRATYAQLRSRADGIARYLVKLGAGPEVRIGLCLERSVEWVAGMLGILKAGAAYVPLDPSHPPERLAWTAEDARLDVILSCSVLRDRLGLANGRFVALESIPDGDSYSRAVSQSNLAYIIYTSGSTGKPKGVLVEHLGLGKLARAQRDALRQNESDLILQFSPSSCDASIFEVLLAVLSGATLYIGDGSASYPGPSLHRFLRNNAITTVTLPPSVLATLPLEDLPQMKTIISAGEACPPDLAWRCSRNARFLNAYGPTEGTIWATLAEGHPDEAGTIGRPIAGLRVYILDRYLQPVPVGVTGEILLGGDGVARGYLNCPELTASSFVPDPFAETPGRRLYRTGDLGRHLRDGSIQFLGRADDQVKIRGFRVELGEVESTLAAHPAVRSNAVVYKADASGPKQLIAYVVPSDADVRIEEIRRHVALCLPAHMRPDVYVALDALPLAANGKVDRRALRPVPANARCNEAAGWRDPTECSVAAAWEDVLGMVCDPDTNFFDAGGHSLLLAELHEKLQVSLQREIGIVDLLANPTIRSFAEHLGKAELSDASR